MRKTAIPPTSAPPDAPTDYLGYTVARLAAVLEARIENALLAGVGISVRHFGILAHLQRQPGIGSGELARLVMITPQSMGGILATMARRGLIERFDPDRPGGSLTLELTRAGREALARAYLIADDLRTEEDTILGRADSRVANASLHTLLNGLTASSSLDRSHK